MSVNMLKLTNNPLKSCSRTERYKKKDDLSGGKRQMSNVYDADDEITNINNEYADVKVAHEISGKIILIFVNHPTKHQDRSI